MVREVGVGASVVEGEHTSDEERAFVVGGREGSAEGSAGLAVAHKAVGKEEAVLGREAVGYLARLAHEAVLELGGVGDARPVVDDGVLTDDAYADGDDGTGYALQRAVSQAEGSVDDAAVGDVAVRDVVGVGDAHVVADGSDGQAVGRDVLRDEATHNLGELLVLLVLDHEGSKLGIESVENHHVAVAHLVEDGDDLSLAKGGIGRGVDAADVFDEAVVADDAVAQRSTTYAAMLHEPIGGLYRLAERAKMYFSVEISLMNVVGTEVVCNRDALPVLSRAALGHESSNLVFVKFPHKTILLPNYIFSG